MDINTVFTRPKLMKAQRTMEASREALGREKSKNYEDQPGHGNCVPRTRRLDCVGARACVRESLTRWAIHNKNVEITSADGAAEYVGATDP